MITSHAHQPQPPSTDIDTMTSSSTAASVASTAADPFTTADASADSPAQFEDDFDIPPINLPPSALEDPQPHPQHDYNNGASSYYPQQHQMYPQQHHYQQQHQQQQQWVNNQYMNNGYPPQYSEYNNGSSYGYGMHYQQQQQQSMAGVAIGGPSPSGGSHNTPSPTGHSEDGDQEVRNNNILKQSHPYLAAGGAQPQAAAPNGGHGQHPYAGHYAQGPAGGPVHAHHHGVHHPMHHHHHHVNVMPKKPKVSKRKKKRDPNEPQKPVSAYALFFRDSQASIKAANPNAAFGDVSKIVASMWDNLDPDSKANYKKRTENAKKDYLKKLAAYRASLVSKGSGDIGYGFSPYGGYHSHHHQNEGAMKTHFMPGSSPGSTGSTPVGAPGSGGAANTYLGQPIPPRPPMQQAPPGAMAHHMHHQHGSFMTMHGQVNSTFD
jgi:hypothetical protein